MATHSSDIYLKQLRRDFGQLGRRIENGDENQLLIWVIPSRLACSHRPLRHNRLYGGSLRNLDSGATDLVRAWAKRIRGEGIRSIICLMSKEEVEWYARLTFEAGDPEPVNRMRHSRFRD